VISIIARIYSGSHAFPHTGLRESGDLLLVGTGCRAGGSGITAEAAIEAKSAMRGIVNERPILSCEDLGGTKTESEDSCDPGVVLKTGMDFR